MDVIKKPFLAAISGIKNSGKTTFLEKLVAELNRRGYKVAVIKHDGHEFEPDVPGTDSWRMRKAGAYGSAVFSKGQWMVSKQEPDMDEQQMAKLFPEADFILLEGFKYSEYPKFEIVRKENLKEPVCDPGTLLGLVTDLSIGNGAREDADRLDFALGRDRFCGKPILRLEDWNMAADILERCIDTEKQIIGHQKEQEIY